MINLQYNIIVTGSYNTYFSINLHNLSYWFFAVEMLG